MNNWQRILAVLGMLIVIAASFFLFQGAQSQQPNTLQAVTFSAVGTGASINEKNTGVAWHQIVWRTNGTVSTCTIGVDSSADGSSWNSLDVITGQTCTSNGSFTVAAAAYYNFVRIHVTVLSGGGSVTAVYMGWTNNPTAGGASFPLTSPTANPAASGQLRLANNTDKVCWRNAANNGDECIYFDSSNVFQVGGAIASAPSGGAGGTLTLPEGTCSAPSVGNSVICAKSDHTIQYSVNGGALAQLAPPSAAGGVSVFGMYHTNTIGSGAAAPAASNNYFVSNSVNNSWNASGTANASNGFQSDSLVTGTIVSATAWWVQNTNQTGTSVWTIKVCDLSVNLTCTSGGLLGTIGTITPTSANCATPFTGYCTVTSGAVSWTFTAGHVLGIMVSVGAGGTATPATPNTFVVNLKINPTS